MRSACPAAFAQTVSLGPLVIPSYRLFLIVTALLVCLAIGTLLAKTQVGALIRATSEDPEMAALLRVNTRAVSTMVFAGGSALAALAGALAAPVFSVHPSMGEELDHDGLSGGDCRRLGQPCVARFWLRSS